MNITKNPRGLPEGPCQHCGTIVPHKAMDSHIANMCEKVPGADPTVNYPPGTVMGVGTGAPYKVLWTMKDLEAAYPKDTWKTIEMPPKTAPVTWNGLRIDVTQGQSITLPPIHHTIYWNSIRNDENLARPRQQGDLVTRVVGVGPLGDT